MTNTFGGNLKRLMEDANLSARELALKIDVPVKTLTEWLGPGYRMPRNPGHLKKISQFFNCSIHHLLFGEEDPQSIIGSILEKTEIHTGLYEISIKKVRAK
ncbi:MAG: helix-turn-helix domain-containing protein [Oligoflexales bacterium]